MERLLKILKANTCISDYRVTIEKTHQYQLFFVQDKIETNRLVDNISYKVSVYVDVNDKRGMGNFTYASYQSDKEVLNNLDEAIYNAKLALNPHYELPKPNGKKLIKLETNLADKDLSLLAEEVAKAIFSANMSEECYSSATEIFLTKKVTRIINSQGLDVSEEKCCGEIELIPTFEKDGKEVEVYHMIRFMEFNQKQITKEVNEVLDLVRSRYEAIELPKGLAIPVIVDGEEVSQFFDYVAEDTDYSIKYTKNNLYEINQDIQKDKKGTKLNLTLAPFYKGAYWSRGFDIDGIVLDNISVVKDGVIVSRHGTNQFGQYIKEVPTGHHEIKLVKPGTVSFEDMKKHPYLRCVRFSALQIDRINGYYGGEVRLGFYFDGEKEIPVTGFTVSCNLHDVIGDINYSKEEETYSDYHGPKYLFIPKMNIN